MTTVVVIEDDGKTHTFKSVRELLEISQRQLLLMKLENVEFNWNALTHTTTDKGFNIEILEVDDIAMFIADNATLLRGLL